ncbi:TonB family protein [Acinetobacter sp. MD2(2019)]|uniref:energy transducer TonB n=1 Tax=Acinetobacter sp. MD2(2019) TaxID=2605273 RepID=UPI002D1E707A|nr:TonB family protein [Acinetobacter sp. MD2(2019)]MEB3752993.1 TonB family protein [Acinetobacter sp. MD2(2019)]
MLAVMLALITHVIFLSIQFVMPHQNDAAQQEIAVTVRPASVPIEHADFVAQNDQQGSGQFRQKHRMSSQLAPAPETQTASDQQLEQLQSLQQQRELKFQEKVLMTVLSWQKQSEDQQHKKEIQDLQSQYQAKAAMIASLEAQYMQREHEFSHQQKIKTVDGIQAKRDASAAYLNKFREKVELYGNRYYPEAAKQQKLSGNVRLMVILNTEGGIRAIHLLQTSGSTILDEAAKASVRRGAPFGRFDASMNDISELRIIRTWRFDPAEAEFEVK